MNCYDCEFFVIRYNNVLEEEAFCEKYNKMVPVNLLAYNFFCWDGDMKPKVIDNDGDRHIKTTLQKQRQMDVYQRDIYGNRCGKNYCNSSTKSSHNKKLRRNIIRRNGRETHQLFLQDY